MTVHQILVSMVLVSTVSIHTHVTASLVTMVKTATTVHFQDEFYKPPYFFFLIVIDIDDCRNSPCGVNGTCIDAVNSYSCNCTTGFTGNNCEISNNRLNK